MLCLRLRRNWTVMQDDGFTPSPDDLESLQGFPTVLIFLIQIRNLREVSDGWSDWLGRGF